MAISDIADVLGRYNEFIILTHFSADGDAIGSSFAMAFALEQIGKHVCVILEEEIPKIYSFLPSGKVYCLKTSPPEKIQGEYAAIVLDCGDIARLGERKSLFINAAATVNIDHHHTNSGYAQHNLIDDSYSSTGEMVFTLLPEIGAVPDNNIALCLYVAIITDTGGFKHSSTNSRTHSIVSELLKYEIDTSFIAMQVFDRISRSKVRLMTRALNGVRFFSNNLICVLKISERDFNETRSDDEDTEGLVELARNIEDVEIAILIRETKTDKYRVNLRSNSEFDVSAVAALFDGGGHKKAAGCNFSGDYESNLIKLVSEIGARLQVK